MVIFGQNCHFLTIIHTFSHVPVIYGENECRIRSFQPKLGRGYPFRKVIFFWSFFEKKFRKFSKNFGKFLGRTPGPRPENIFGTQKSQIENIGPILKKILRKNPSADFSQILYGH